MGLIGKFMIFCILASLSSISNSKAAPADSRISYVPGYNDTLPSEHYGGGLKTFQSTFQTHFSLLENPMQEYMFQHWPGKLSKDSLDGIWQGRVAAELAV